MSTRHTATHCLRKTATPATSPTRFFFVNFFCHCLVIFSHEMTRFFFKGNICAKRHEFGGLIWIFLPLLLPKLLTIEDIFRGGNVFTGKWQSSAERACSSWKWQLERRCKSLALDVSVPEKNRLDGQPCASWAMRWVARGRTIIGVRWTGHQGTCSIG